MRTLVGRLAVVTKVNDGLGYDANDKKYTEKAKGKLIKLVASVPNTQGFYISDFFIPEFIDLNNDYIHYGFLKVSTGNISLVEE